MNTMEFIILPTSPAVTHFLELSSRMSIVDYDLVEVMSVALDALSVGPEINERVTALVNTYSSFRPEYQDDALIIKNALQVLLKDLTHLIDVHQLRDRFGYFHYVFEGWHNKQYESVLKFRH